MAGWRIIIQIYGPCQILLAIKARAIRDGQTGHRVATGYAVIYGSIINLQVIKIFLSDTAYPLMKGAATFCLDWLVEDPRNGYLVIAPSVSPENVFSYADGKVSDVSVATTMDMSIVWDLFTNLLEASKALNIDADFRKLLEEKKAKLYPMHIGHLGNLQEWSEDYEDVEVHHRHVSHLFGLYPGYEICPVSTPDFAAAAKKTLEIRGDDGTGWSKAWKINFWARLLDGNHAYLLLKQLLTAYQRNRV